jgi:hypothetical protein
MGLEEVLGDGSDNEEEKLRGGQQLKRVKHNPE